MIKNVRKSLKWPKVVLPLTVIALIIFAAGQIPIEKMRYGGGCRSKNNRLSLILDGQEKINNARENVAKMNHDRQERSKLYPMLSDGCSPGLSYTVYIF